MRATAPRSAAAGPTDTPRGKSVLCLAGGDGQQSAAFGLLGAKVSVVDFSEAQLEKDREVAVHYGLVIDTVEGDMRDLSHFADDSFDVVYHSYSINFVPDADTVLGTEYERLPVFV